MAGTSNISIGVVNIGAGIKTCTIAVGESSIFSGILAVEIIGMDADSNVDNLDGVCS